MQAITFITLLLVAARVTVAVEQLPEVVSSSQPVEHVHQTAPVVAGQGSAAGVLVPEAPVSGVVSGGSSSPVSGAEHHESHVEHQQQFHAPPAYYSPAAGMVVVEQPASYVQHSSVVKHPQQVGAASFPRHYANPAALVSVSSSPSSPAAPAIVAPAEQYGQPESASIPANYKPFGSWGLYIGGNPADGYYTNYYKSLASSVEKQQQAQSGSSVQSGVAPVAEVKPGVSGAPLLRQAFGSSVGYAVSPSTSPVSGADVYPFDHSYYTPADLSSSNGARFVSPVQAGSQVYGTPSASYEPGSSLLSYAADSYAGSTKKLGPVQQQQQKEVQSSAQQQQSKGYQTRFGYVYSPVVQAAGSVQPALQPQVVAYPVPVGSQIVGSQPGVEGAFQPYGVHAFTRYAVKPTVVAGEQHAHHYYQAPQAVVSSYKQVQSPATAYQYQPLSFYGFPLGQLHYSSSPFSSQVSPSSTGAYSASHSVSVPSSGSGSAGPGPMVVGVQPAEVVGSSESVVSHRSPVSFAAVPVESAAASEKSEASHGKPAHGPVVSGDKQQPHHQQQ